MARKASGQNILGVAKAYLSKAKTAEALRQDQAVVFPLLYGMSLEKTAEAIGCIFWLGMSITESFHKGRQSY